MLARSPRCGGRRLVLRSSGGSEDSGALEDEKQPEGGGRGGGAVLTTFSGSCLTSQRPTPMARAPAITMPTVEPTQVSRSPLSVARAIAASMVLSPRPARKNASPTANRADPASLCTLVQGAHRASGHHSGNRSGPRGVRADRGVVGSALPRDAPSVLAGLAFLGFAAWTLRGDTLTDEEKAAFDRAHAGGPCRSKASAPSGEPNSYGHDPPAAEAAAPGAARSRLGRRPTSTRI